MSKEAVLILLDVNATMKDQLRKESLQSSGPTSRIKIAKDSIRMLLEQKVSAFL